MPRNGSLDDLGSEPSSDAAAMAPAAIPASSRLFPGVVQANHVTAPVVDSTSSQFKSSELSSNPKSSWANNPKNLAAGEALVGHVAPTSLDVQAVDDKPQNTTLWHADEQLSYKTYGIGQDYATDAVSLELGVDNQMKILLPDDKPEECYLPKKKVEERHVAPVLKDNHADVDQTLTMSFW
ncbi:hypothetical protein Nepgr_003895 [Nepenthes gracilis]|uniref:Uncharacterized protein n=1 Tax=Nepenthes gracilis TaxID=150966 RepID=A0AAD3XEL8_NEPGR|nr:hypothetical protein Nepgr_003895 [Nepenthes gracilis]